MIFGGKKLILAVVCLVLSLTARADVGQIATGAANDDNPYRAIAIRNVFDLHTDGDDHVVPPLLPPKMDVKLTGITTVAGKKLAFLIVNEPAAAGKPTGGHSLILSEGEQAGSLTVLEINPVARTVKLKTGERESLIHFTLAEAGK